MAFDYNYTPIIKGIGFCPNPVGRYGIPAYADSRANPKVIGTNAWDQWWTEQMHYLENGYESGSTKISPNFYWYLNFCPIATVGRGYHLPEYIDTDKEYFDLYSYVKKNNRGIISLKKRRGGLSEKAAKGILGYGMYMNMEKYNAGLCAGLEDYVDDMRMKFRELNSLLPPELKLRFKLSDTDDMIQSGWKDDNQDPAGSKNLLYIRTMFNNYNVFKGKFFNDVVYEEGGEFKHLLKGFSANMAGMKVGLDLKGTPLVYGTSGKSGSKDFRELWNDAKHYRLEKLFIPGYRIMISGFVGSINSEGISEEILPNINKLQKELGLKRDQVLGCEDVVSNDERILIEREELKQANNRELYLEHFLDYPRTEAEALMSVATNNFDRDAISEQQAWLLVQKNPAYSKCVLEDLKDEDGMTLTPRQINMRFATEKDRDDECVYVRKGFEDPLTLRNYRHAYAAGIDSYDQDTSMTSKSLGAMVIILRKGHPYKNDKGDSIGHKRVPILLIRNRPRRKELFYDNCLRASIYFNLLGMVMIDAGKPSIIDYFKNEGGRKFLAPRPLSFEAEDSQQRHDYGMLLNNGKKSKPQMISILQSWVIDEIDECVFPLIVDGISNYNEIEDNSDWDEVDALGLALVVDKDRKLLKSKKDSKDDNLEKEWQYNAGTGGFDLVKSVPRSEKKEGPIENTPSSIFNHLLNTGQL